MCKLNHVNLPQNKVTDVIVVSEIWNLTSHQLLHCFTHSNRDNTDIASIF